MANKTCEKCGKIYSNSGIKSHQRYCKGSNTLEQVSVEVSPRVDDTLKQDPSRGIKQDKNINEVNFMPELTSKKEEVQPVKKEEEFECGKCGAQFSKKVKFCPECGVNFE